MRKALPEDIPWLIAFMEEFYTLRFQQAAKAHLEALLDTGRPIPPAFRDKFILAA